MSNKPDGTNGKKPTSTFKARVFKAKSTKPQKKHEEVVAMHASTGGKVLKVARGTKRALRRIGIVRDWRNLVAKGIETAIMLPA